MLSLFVMSKRLVIWIAVALIGVGAVLALLTLQKHEAEAKGQVTFHRRSGNLAHFLVGELRNYGGTPPASSMIVVLQADWQFAEDPQGFQVLLPKARKADLVQCLTAMFGEPMRRDSYPHLVYKEDRFGVGLVADLDADPIHIICLKKGAL